MSRIPQRKLEDRLIDNYITSKVFGIPLMLLTLALILWITISGANYPSSLLAKFFLELKERLLSSLIIYRLLIGSMVYWF